MTKEYFGTDGIRQKAEDFTPEFIQTIVSGLIRYAGTSRDAESGAERPLRVLVGGDTRESTEWMISDFETALETVGVEHASVSVLPTPAINYAFYAMGFDLAIDVTASHNPYTDNGVKIFERGDAIGGLEAVMPGGVNFKGTGANKSGEDLSDKNQRLNYGVKLSQHGVNSIEAALNSNNGLEGIVSVEYAENLHDDALDRYIEYVKDYVTSIGPTTDGNHKAPNFEGLKIGLDCANGATSVTAEKLFKEFGAEITVINNDASYGQKINNNCGSTHLDALKKLVTENNLDFGVAFDGDGDRCLFVDKSGDEIDGDEIIAIIANIYHINEIAITVMANQGLINWCEENNIKAEITSVGDANVFRAMLEKHIVLGGEQSGHIILPRQPMGDGVLTALVVAKIFSERKQDASNYDDLLDDYEHKSEEEAPTRINPEDITLKSIVPFEKMPQTLLNLEVSAEAKQKITDEKHSVQKVIQKFTDELAEKHWRLLIRPSGTENLVRICVWGDNQTEIEQTAEEIANQIKAELEA